MHTCPEHHLYASHVSLGVSAVFVVTHVMQQRSKLDNLGIIRLSEKGADERFSARRSSAVQEVCSWLRQ